MVVIVASPLFEFEIKINPYLVLGIKKNSTHSETKKKFREKMIEARNDDPLRAKICLAYDIIVNNDFYFTNGNDIYQIKDILSKKEINVYYNVIIGNFFSVIKLIEKNNNLLYFKDPLKRNLLYLAARNGHTNICEYLINKGLEINDIQGSGSTPLHGAVYYGQTNVVKLLLNYGAKTNIFFNSYKKTKMYIFYSL
jgi:ankyrin repeat protein